MNTQENLDLLYKKKKKTKKENLVLNKSEPIKPSNIHPDREPTKPIIFSATNILETHKTNNIHLRKPRSELSNFTNHC